MAPRGKSGETSVVDGLKAIYQQVAALALEPDAGPHMELIQKLQQALLGIVQQITQQKAQQAAQMQQMVRQHAVNPQGVNPMMGGPQGPNPMAGGPGAGQPGGPPSQGSAGIAMPNPDELRRVLAAQGAGG